MRLLALGLISNVARFRTCVSDDNCAASKEMVNPSLLVDRVK